MSSRWRSWTLVLVAVGVGGLAGCTGGGTPAESAASASALAEPAQQVSAAQAATGLRKIERIAKEIARVSAADKAEAAGLDGRIEPIWKPVEDTVRRNDQDTYLAMEDGFVALEKAAGGGDAASADTGSAGISSAVRAYLAKYPG
ncbi:MAG: hypothetical protein JO063_14670 [Pseudonocardiales bacterium]|nr:hypothetical protein [Pseudonocardiales bacterium]MBV9031364.1 hypothetical protein [Pseudonocardiales bacterium]MBW0011329.1 hypothetical protein [Pseudonocardiales bacterium]